jgi:2-methylcitrate dehydratase PrpD
LGALEQLCGFVRNVNFGTVPEPIFSKAKACLLYGLVVGLGATKAPHPRRAVGAMDSGQERSSFDESRPGATTLLDGVRRAPGASAFCNAVLLHSRIQEDAHPAGHVGVVVVPAAIAIGEAHGTDGRTLLAAIVAGYETALRIGREHSADLSARGFRTTPVYGTIGAAAAAARTLEFSLDVTASSLALAANFCGGLREFVEAGTDEFPFHAGFSAQSGLLAATLASQGVSAAKTTLSGRAGFFRAYGREDKDYEPCLTADLGREFEIMRVTYKPYPVCQFHRSIVKGAIDLSQQARGARLSAMQIAMNPFEAEFVGVRYPGPFTSFPQTFMSAPFCAASAWLRGTVTFAGLHDFRDPEILALIPRIAIEQEPGRPRYKPRLQVTLDDGRMLAWEETVGDEAYLLDWQAAVALANAITDEIGIPLSAIERLIECVSEIDAQTSLGDLVATASAVCHAAAAGAASTLPSHISH